MSLRYTVTKPKVMRPDWLRKEVVGFTATTLLIEVNDEEQAKQFARDVEAKLLRRGWPYNQAIHYVPEVMIPCDRCSGRGVYHWGAIVNGVPTHSGDCFRCGAKGYQNYDDRKRNYGYDNHQRAF